jgi:hypothetical protein
VVGGWRRRWLLLIRGLYKEISKSLRILSQGIIWEKVSLDFERFVDADMGRVKICLEEERLTEGS